MKGGVDDRAPPPPPCMRATSASSLSSVWRQPSGAPLHHRRGLRRVRRRCRSARPPCACHRAVAELDLGVGAEQRPAAAGRSHAWSITSRPAARPRRSPPRPVLLPSGERMQISNAPAGPHLDFGLRAPCSRPGRTSASRAPPNSRPGTPSRAARRRCGRCATGRAEPWARVIDRVHCSSPSLFQVSRYPPSRSRRRSHSVRRSVIHCSARRAPPDRCGRCAPGRSSPSDEPRALQHRQMLHHRRQRHRQRRASSLTEAGPCASRSIIARRVGSASAWNARSSGA